MSTPNQDTLLAELNGEMPPLAPGESAPIQAPSRESQLTVNPIPAPTAVQSADSVHATKAGGKGYKIRVKGEYYAMSAEGKGKIKKPYTLEFVVTQLEGAASVIKNKLIKPALKKKYPEALGDRTISIIDATPLSPAMSKSNNLAYMDRPQLEQYVLSSQPKIPIDPAPENYPDVTHLREAIIDYIQNPDGFVQREKERQDSRLQDRELAALNPGLDLAG